MQTYEKRLKETRIRLEKQCQYAKGLLKAARRISEQTAMQKGRDMHLPYLSQHFLCKLSTLCTFCLHCVDIQAFTQCIQPRILPTLLPALPAFYLHYLHFCLHYLHFYLHFCLHYLHFCLHCLHACLHCIDFHVVMSVYNRFFVCTTIYTAYIVAQPYTCERGAVCASKF